MVINELNLTAEVISTIEVRNDIVAKIVIDSVPKTPVDVTNWIKGQASISYVVPKCVAKWSIVNENGYAYENFSALTGTGIGGLIVNDFEANFLKEMNDYTNSTVTKHVKLHIPPANTYPNWNGLKPDSRYFSSFLPSEIRLSLLFPSKNKDTSFESPLTAPSRLT